LRRTVFRCSSPVQRFQFLVEIRREAVAMIASMSVNPPFFIKTLHASHLVVWRAAFDCDSLAPTRTEGKAVHSTFAIETRLAASTARVVLLERAGPPQVENKD
jgi:hypothetical protein